MRVFHKIDNDGMLDIIKPMLPKLLLPALLGNALVCLVAYHYMQHWLRDFADHILLKSVYFIISVTSKLLIA